MTVVHVLDEAGVEIVPPIEVDGRVLLPSSIPIDYERHGRDLWISRRQARLGDGGPDQLVGWLQLPVLSRASATTLEVWLPPPAPFASSDIEGMWVDVEASGVGVPSGLALQGRRWGATDRRQLQELQDFAPLGGLLAAARTLIRSWPERQARELVWRPLSLPGGREEEVETLRHPRSHVGRTHRGVLRPELTARSITRMEPWKLSSISNGSATLRRSLAEALIHDGEDLAPIMDLIGAVEVRSAPIAHTPDPLMSSWPDGMRSYYRLLLSVLSEVLAGQGREGLVPLSDLWRLYQTWVGATVYSGLVDQLGQPRRVHRSSAEAILHAEWDDVSGGTVTLGLQTVFTAMSPVTDGYTAVSSALQPDVTIRYDFETRTSILLIDAKKRQGEVIGRASAAEAASKYLWGIRRVGQTNEPSHDVIKVLLVSPAGAEPMLDPAASRIGSHRARKSAGDVLPISSWLGLLGVT